MPDQNTARRFRHKATVVAAQFQPDSLPWPDEVEVRNSKVTGMPMLYYVVREVVGGVGVIRVKPGQWVVTDSYGRRTLFDPGDFELMYEPVSQPE